MGYRFGNPATFDRPETIVGEKRDDGVYLSLVSRIKLLVECPEGSEAGGEVDADEIDAQLRQACADALHGLAVGPFVVASACVQEFEDG
jgi:hypothetical protein